MAQEDRVQQILGYVLVSVKPDCAKLPGLIYTISQKCAYQNNHKLNTTNMFVSNHLSRVLVVQTDYVTVFTNEFTGNTHGYCDASGPGASSCQGPYCLR